MSSNLSVRRVHHVAYRVAEGGMSTGNLSVADWSDDDRMQAVSLSSGPSNNINCSEQALSDPMPAAAHFWTVMFDKAALIAFALPLCAFGAPSTATFGRDTAVSYPTAVNATYTALHDGAYQHR